jgi:6,7-dimethyl-8-ribityllumazine synthase
MEKQTQNVQELFTKERRIGVIISAWHAELVSVCKQALYHELTELGVDVENTVTLVEAPGALEFPLIAQTMAKTGDYAAIAVIALVVDGGIYRHEFVAQAVVDGIVRVSLDTNVPVLSASLTPQKFDEKNEDHKEFFKNHLVIKGKELAHACVETVQALQGI